MTDIGSTALQIASLVAQGAAVGQKINEAKADYASEISRLETQKTIRETTAEGEIVRGKEMGIAVLTERGAQSAYETNEAMRKAAQTASAAESRIGAGGVQASGTALAAAQQETDIAYAGAARAAEAGTAQMKIGGLQLKGQLAGAREQKSLLTMEYGQTITEQKRKLAELEHNATAMINQTLAGGLAGVYSSFYKSSANPFNWDWSK